MAQPTSRQDIVGEIRRVEQRYERHVTWAGLTTAQAKGCLEFSLPSGYCEWLVVQPHSIWWVSYDASDGGSWGPLGVNVIGYAIRYRDDIVTAINRLRSEQLRRSSKDNAYANRK